MNIGIIGNGFVGQAIVHGFILHIDNILVYDKDPKKSTSSMKELVYNSNVIFICVPTPMFESGECDLSIVESVVKELSQYDCINKKVIVIKSTVVPGTTEYLAENYPEMNFVLFLNFELVNLPKMHIFCIFPHDQGEVIAYLPIRIHLSRKE